MHQIALPALEALVTLSPCEDPPPVPVVTTVAPVAEHHTLYLSTGSCLYAVNAADGTARWCQQVKLTRTREAPPPPPGLSMPPPPRAKFATPRVVDGARGTAGVLYLVCEYGFGSYTCAFAADDGAILWWTPTDARVASMPFMDWAVPLVADGIVYSGTYALNQQDGSVRWRVAIGTDEEGSLALHALADGMIYATSHRGIYVINAHDGHVRWLYRPPKQAILAGPPLVSGGLLYVGIRGSIGYAEKSHFFALDIQTGAEVWRYPIGSYIGAVVQRETIYISSGDGFVYAMDTKSGALRWRQPPDPVGQYLRDPAIVADGILYLAADGVYALRQTDGEVLWHQPLASVPSPSFGQPAVLDGAVYVTCVGRHRQGVLYALDRRTGTECWRAPYISVAIAVAQ